MNIEKLMQMNEVESLYRPVTMYDLIESAAMQELRICCLELGLDPNDFVQEDD